MLTLFCFPSEKGPTIKGKELICSFYIQSTLVISNSKGLSETLRDIRTSKYQSCRIEESNNSNNHI